MTVVVPLARLAEYVNGRAFRPEEKTASGLPVLRIKQLVDPLADYDFYDGPLEPRHRVGNGDLIFSWSATLAVELWQRGDAALNQHLFNVHPAPGVDKGWLRWALHASLDKFRSLMHGSAMTHITKEMLRDVQVRLPPLDEQRRIAGFLYEQVALLDRAVELRQQQVVLLERRYRSAVEVEYLRLVTECGSGRLGWFLMGLEQGWSPQCEDRVTEAGEYGVLKAGCVNGGVFRPEQHKALPPNIEPRLEYLIRPGDLLMSRASGSLELIGSAAVVPEGTPNHLLLCDKVYRLRPLPAYDASFLAVMLQAQSLREAIKLGTSGAEGMANNLPSGTIRGLRVPDAPQVQQRLSQQELSQRGQAVSSALQSLGRSQQLLLERKHALITAAVSGEFDVSTARSAA